MYHNIWKYLIFLPIAAGFASNCWTHSRIHLVLLTLRFWWFTSIVRQEDQRRSHFPSFDMNAHLAISGPFMPQVECRLLYGFGICLYLMDGLIVISRPNMHGTIVGVCRCNVLRQQIFKNEVTCMHGDLLDSCYLSDHFQQWETLFLYKVG